MSFVRRLLVLACTAALILPGTAEAVHGYGCGGSWTTFRLCTVRLQGLPLTADGHAYGPGANLHVRLGVPTFAGDITIIECSATDASDGFIDGHASCISDPLQSQQLAMILGEVVVRCWVTGKSDSRGTYFCNAGSTQLPV
jgi:hypothetical protein